MSTELQRMTAQRAVFFLERFKREEKMLGPNEQAALDFAILALRPQSESEPFGYFRATPDGWEDCSEHDEGAKALYEHPQAGEAMVDINASAQKLL